MPSGWRRKINLLHADDGGGGTLLVFAQLGRLFTRDVRLGDAHVAAGDEHVTYLGAGLHPARHRAGTAKLDVVGMGHDDHGAGGNVEGMGHGKCSDS